METTIVYWGYIGIMENEMGTAMLIFWRLMALRLLIDDGTSKLAEYSAANGGFPKLTVPFLGVPIIRTVVFGVL